ncbi:hypothetical protein [Pseudalkalibacillus hwajinpoensis]|uniref:hypothetical protein n=1 Tax=Guptibacillus hwajinpoensis TaxID=208199 RepID=UPI001CFEA052|nr:hypothetical protein [Pseudalkalibacillus hwajinpoensis]
MQKIQRSQRDTVPGFCGEKLWRERPLTVRLGNQAYYGTGSSAQMAHIGLV